MIPNGGQISYQEWLERSLNLVERVGDIFTGLDERLDYLNQTMIRVENLLEQMVRLLKGVPPAPPVAPPAPPPVVPPAVAPPPVAPPLPEVIYVQPPAVKFPIPFLISEDSGIASGGSSTTLRDDTRFWQDNILRGGILALK